MPRTCTSRKASKTRLSWIKGANEIEELGGKFKTSKDICAENSIVIDKGNENERFLKD